VVFVGVPISPEPIPAITQKEEGEDDDDDDEEEEEN
jgi:hypothetical protein